VEEWYAAQLAYGEAISGKKHVRSGTSGGGNKQIDGIKENASKSCIYLMTIHASKGLEFDHVWIPDCNEKIFPHGSMPDKATVEEERRIFYVAMTRAKKSLGLLYLTGTKEHPRQPSRFLNSLWSEHDKSSNK